MGKPTYESCSHPGYGSKDFMECVIRNTLSIVPSNLMNFFTLGLAYHVEHHLFPSVPYWLIPRVNELVTEYCATNAIRCNNNCSYVGGYRLYIEALWQLGNRPDRAALATDAPEESHEQLFKDAELG